MGLMEKREAEIALELKTDPRRAHEALMKSFGAADLKVTFEDKARFTAVAETSKMKAMLRNSFGEAVNFTISDLGGRCLVTLKSAGKSPMGMYSHESIFRKMRESLEATLGVTNVQGATPQAAQAGGGNTGAAFSARTREVARAEKLPGELMRAVGANGAVVVFPDHISILRITGALTGILQGMKGDKDIRIAKLASVQLRKPGNMTRGYLQFELMGGMSSQGGLLDATQDENTVLFDVPDLEAFLQVKAKVDSLMAAKELGAGMAPAPARSAASELKEWKELLDAGAVTQAEYDAKKAELLSKK